MPVKHNAIFDRRRFDDEEAVAGPVTKTTEVEDEFVPFQLESGVPVSGLRDPSFRPLYLAIPAADQPEDAADTGAPPTAEQEDEAEPAAEFESQNEGQTGEGDEAAIPDDKTPEAAEDTPPQPGFSDEDLQAARQAGYDEGLQAGQAAAAEDGTAKAADMLEKVADGLSQIEQSRADEIAEAAGEAVRVGVAIVNQLFPAIRAKAAEREVRQFVTRHLGDAADARALVVQVHESMVETMTDQMRELSARSGFTGNLTVQADEALEPGDARLDWREGGVERLYETLWSGIRAALVRSIGQIEPSEAAMAAKAAQPPAKQSPAKQQPGAKPATAAADTTSSTATATVKTAARTG